MSEGMNKDITPDRSPEGLRLPCVMCGEANAVLDLDISTRRFTCRGCRRQFDTSDVWKILEEWPPVVRWAEALPVDGD